MLKKQYRLFVTLVVFLVAASSSAFASVIYQDFEPNNGSDQYGWTINSTAGFSSGARDGFYGSGQPVFTGRRAWMTTGSRFWDAGTGIQSQTQRWDINLVPEENDRLVFWIYALPERKCYVYGCEGPTDNTVNVKFFDTGRYNQGGVEVWTTNTARYGQWTKLWILFSQLPPDFDLHHVNKIEFLNYNPGTYIYDAIAAVHESRVHQSFEPVLRSGSVPQDFGWKWNEGDAVGLSGAGEPVHEGSYSWKMVLNGYWGGGGFQSQEKRFLQTGSTAEQSFWRVDLNPAQNDRLTFWAYGLPSNGLDNNMSVQFYDNQNHFTDDTKVAVWSKASVRQGGWTKMTVLFKDLPPTLNLKDINKIQFQVYWPGTYYFDDIRAEAPLVSIRKDTLLRGLLSWAAIPGAGRYRVQESISGPDGPWAEAYKGSETSYQTLRLIKSWFRARWEAPPAHPHPGFISSWSEPFEYNPAAVLINKERLRAGVVEWSVIPSQASEYEVQARFLTNTPWNTIYTGSFPARVVARHAEWYRVRAIRRTNGSIAEAGVWSPAVKYDPGREFLKAVGTQVKVDGGGDPVTLRGVNLGAYLLIERWMTGLGAADTPPVSDDWSIRDILIKRFGKAQTNQLLEAYQNAYFQDYDLDRLLEMGVTVVRLPIYYRIFMEDSGKWILNSRKQIDFGPIDRVVNACADRGLYVILDLHGAPGGQSAGDHTGRAGINKLFEPGSTGENYRKQTIKIWQELAKRYKNNPTVAAYDLLNEPIGAPTPQILWSLYDRLYKAIRQIDSNHIIMMEGIWDWDTLPAPTQMGWLNVMYQFHYYLFDDPATANVNETEDVESQKAFIDKKILDAKYKQSQYQVPAMVGEFSGFSQKASWDYFLSRFNEQGWWWTMWSNKYHDASSTWGLYTHTDYDEALPKFRAIQADGTPGDSYADLKRKLSQYDTLRFHELSPALVELHKAAFLPVASDPVITDYPPDFNVQATPFNAPPGEFAIGGGHGDSFRSIQFVPWAPCSNVPTINPLKPCNNGSASIIYWSDTLIRGVIPPDATGSFTTAFSDPIESGVDFTPQDPSVP